MAGVKTLMCGVWTFATFAMGASAAANPDDDVPADEAIPDEAVPDEALPDEALPDETLAPPGLWQPMVQPPQPIARPPAAPWQAPRISAMRPRTVPLDGDLAGRGAVTVTGSLIERSTRTGPSPVTFVSRDELLASGRTMVGDILQTLPEQGNAINAQVNNGGDGSTQLNLRGLGSTRTLVLLDGRRFVPVGTGADATVDLNTIPLAAIERVEVLNDAASAVYGSDAIGGVVNLITRSRFTGAEASLITAQTEREDGFTYDASFIAGHRTDDSRGNIVFSAGMQRQDPVFAGDRAFSEFDKAFDFTTQTEVRGGSTSTPGGRINARQIDVNGDGRGDVVNVCGVGVTFCTSNGAGGFRPFISPDDNYNFAPVNYLYTPSSRFNAFSAGGFKIGRDTEAFFQMSFMHRESEQQLAPEPFASFVPISRDSIFNPFGGTVLQYNRRLEEFGPRRFSQSVDTFRVVTGLRGAIDGIAGADSWTWELSFNHGRTDSTEKQDGHLIRSRLADTLGPSFINANGVPTCGTPVAPIPGCFPMNIIGPSGSIDPRAVAYTAFTGISSGVDEQQTVLAQASGRLARIGRRGDLSLAIAADMRRESGEFTPDPLIATGDTTGVSQPSTTGSLNALEAFAELQLVAARDRDGLERLELDLAARTSRYDSFGDVTAWNARALARPVRSITLRATSAQAFRAPNVLDLFRGEVDAFPVAQDPCENLPPTGGPPSLRAECIRQGVAPGTIFGTFQQRVVTGGNPDVQPETSRVATAGVVIEPPGALGLSLSVDFWRISLDEKIQEVSINTIFANCYQRGIRSFCDQIHRNPALRGAIDFVESPVVNVGSTATSGIDAAISLDHRVGPFGRLRARFSAQHLVNFDVDDSNTVVNGLGVYDLGVFPQMKWNLFAAWQHAQGLSAGFNVQFIGDFLECDQNDCNSGQPSRPVESYTKVDVFSSLALGRGRGESTLSFGVNNVMDRNPPLIYVGFAGDSDASTYNYLGRMFWARLTQRF